MKTAPALIAALIAAAALALWGWQAHRAAADRAAAVAAWESACAAVTVAKADLDAHAECYDAEFIGFIRRRAEAARAALRTARTPAEVAMAQDDLAEARREEDEIKRERAAAEARLRTAEARRAETIGPAQKALGRRFQY